MHQVATQSKSGAKRLMSVSSIGLIRSALAWIYTSRGTFFVLLLVFNT